MTQNTSFERDRSPREQSIPERFEEIVTRYPDRLAVKFAGRSFTYSELNEQSNRIAHWLLRLTESGITSVALLFGHGINVVSAMIGTLKAGKQVCALESHAPEERMRFILKDCQSSLIVTDNRHFDLAQRVANGACRLINVDELDAALPANNLGLPIAPNQTALIAYTSGSTGQPRGFARTHCERVIRAISSSNYRKLCAEDRLSLLHSVSFGTGSADLFLALLNGVAVLPFDVRSEGVLGLAKWLKQERITIFHSPPAVFRELANLEFSPDYFSDLTLIRLSGAPITQRDFDYYRVKFHRGTRLEVGMGSAEMEAICNAIVDQDFWFPKEGSPVGHARERKDVLILDDEGHELGPGEIGEIAVKSRDFAEDYWHQPNWIEGKFRRDPKDADALIYLTGDLGTRLADGFIIHRGRKDLMVKIRGFRVDISEVERALLEHPTIKEAGVRAWDREEGEKFLAGYIVPRPESELNASEVRDFLSNKLADYMIPTAFKFVEALPLTNGKLNRLALPKPDTRRPELQETYVAPRNEVEGKLAAIWSEVLQIDDIGVHDNFFDLGGHSLAASRVLSRVFDCFRVEVSARSFFESPTLTGLGRNVENALRQGLSEKNLPLVPVPRGSHLPTSFAQRALWFHDQLEPGSCAYNLVFSYRLSGELDVQVLGQSINQIVARHEVLRTIFEAVDGQPVQKILPTMTIGLEVMDLSHLLSESLQDSEVRRFARVLAEQPFDLTRGPLLRPALLRLASNEHVFLLAIHHVVFDGWSTGVFFRELSEIYNCLRTGKPCSLPELHIQYADFAMWERQRLCDANLAEHLSYWRSQLDNLSTLNLPFKRSQPAAEGSSSAREAFEISGDLLDGLKSLMDRSGSTLFMVLLAAWKAALHRYTGQTDIAIGTFVSGRNHPAVEELIGYFLNLVVLRSDLSGDPTVCELLGRIRRVCIDAFAHQDLPFEKLVEELRPTRHVTINPLVQATFALQNTPQQSLNLTGIAARDLDIGAGVARPFDLHLYVIEEETSLRGYVSYNKSLFETDTIKRLIDHLKNLLKAIAADKDGRISALPMLTEQEKHQLLFDWNHTEAEYPRDKCVHELFENQVERTPDSIAMVFEDQQLTYRELNQKANQLAHYLQKLGIRPDVAVGICVQRSLEMVVGLLGVLKAGGAYVPLDAHYPQERLAFMLEDSGACLLLTQKSLVEDGRWRIEDGDSRFSIPSTLLSTGLDARLKVVCLDNEWETIARESRENLSSGVTAGNLAYVIYTSGSTGRPKGVAIEHHSTVALLSWAQTVFSAEEMAGVLASTSICFDLSVFELFGPLTSGGQVILAADAIALPGLVAAPRVTLINTVPSAITELLRAKAIPSSVCTICLAGEPLTTGLVKDLYEQTSATKVYDLYGPSEDTTYSTFALRTKAGPQTVGRPIANTEVFILDRQRQPVPIGVCGELYIGGAGLARGYLNQPELTAEKFIPNPFSDQPGVRLYRTGDLARYLADGNIEFLGRTDNQVKIRGYRIELGDIESVLREHPGVVETVVAAREEVENPKSKIENPKSNKRLVAYVVPHESSAPTISELRAFLKQKLPQHMIPSAFVLVDALPLTANGKIDRRKLPAPDRSQPEREQSYQEARTPMETMLAEIWAEVLKLESIGVHDNFFDLGGHSLLATQVISRISGIFQLELPVRALFEASTAAELAERMEQARRTEPRVPLLPVSRDKDLPLSFAQQRLWFLDQLEPDSTAYHVPWALRLRGPLNVSTLEGSLGEIVKRHETLRTRFSTAAGEPVQIICPQLNLKLQLVDLSDLAESEREDEARKRANEEVRQRFNLAEGPLLRATLLRLADQDHVLVLILHHIVADGWSMGVLQRELSVLYQAFSNAQPSPLPDLPIQYADFAVWQRQWLQGEVLESQLSYWKKQLEGAPAILNMPMDRPRPPLQSFRGARRSLELSKGLTRDLKNLSRRNDVTLFMTLLAAFQTLLYRYTGQEDVVVGSPIANRSRSEIENLIGFFVNTLVLRSNLAGDPTFRDLLARVREVALEAFAHQDLPFEKLVEDLNPERNLSHSPLFQVMFVLQNASATSRGFGGLTFQSFGMGNVTAKFDLTLSMREEADALRGSLEYNTDLFDAATIDRLIGHFQNLLQEIVSNADRRISDLPILTAAEKQQLLVGWNDTNTEYPKDKCIHELFEAQVEKTPDAVAVVFEDQQLTYRELNTRANQVARYLQKLGVGPEALVAICMERSLEMVIGLLGILKAGCAYVPLDPDYPQERLAFMMEDSRASLLLTQKSLVEDGRWRIEDGDSRLKVVCLDREWERIARESRENPSSGVTAGNLAYVIYTSGSAGKPKGAMIQHYSLVNCLDSMARQPSLTKTDILLAVTTLSFDIAALEIFLPLVVGARVVVARREIGTDGMKLAELLSGCRATVMQATPVTWRMLLSAGWQGSSELKILCGGEVFSEDLARRLGHRCSSLWNMYGPTETTIWSAVECVPADIHRVTLGYPIANTQFHILDRHRHPVPVGVVGELHIGDEGLARGYLNRPELTAEKFIPHPLSDKPGARLYRTGDLARYLTDGNIEFLGRMDSQVKIRGYRIELGEIEAVLSQHPAVLEALVVAQNDALNKRLVAYVVHRPGADTSVNELREFLKQKLPDYMIPSVFVVLDALPLTPNGKVDHRALPAPDQSRPELEQSYYGPRTPVERKLAEIWAEILKLKKVGVHDNFFALGGHSLLATQVMSRVGSIFRIKLPLRSLFELPTVKELAEAIVTKQATTLDNDALTGILTEIENSSDTQAERAMTERTN